MEEVSKHSFKEMYFRHGNAVNGWIAGRWGQQFEEEGHNDWKYMLELPRSSSHSSMMIVSDYGMKEYRMSFWTEDEVESFYDHPGRE